MFKIISQERNPSSYPVSMDEVLQLMSDQDQCPFVILKKLQYPLLHQMITEVDVQGREWIILKVRNPKTRLTLLQYLLVINST